jgi:hypothetical protein
MTTALLLLLAHTGVLPLAHAGHWVWLLYVPPVAIVVFAIVRTSIAERRKERRERERRKPNGE